MISPARADSRDDWLKIGMALQSISQSLLGEWVGWSRQSAKFEEGECERQWKGFKPDKARSIGIGTLIRWAREDSGNKDFGSAQAEKPPMPPGGFKTIADAIRWIEEATYHRHVTTWAYLDADASPSFWVARFNDRCLDAHGKLKKTFRPIRPAKGRFELGDPKGLLPLYRLPDLPRRGRVYGVEGEKAADAGAEVGLATTTSAHGALSAAKSDWSPLAGCDVVLFPDRDADGRRYVEEVRRILLALDPPAKVRIVELPGLGDGGDLFDFISAAKARGETAQAIRSTVEALAESAQASDGNEGGPKGPFQNFAEPIELPDMRPAVPPFDYAMVPQSLAPWIRDIAQRMQCAADFVFAAAIVALSAVLGRKVGIRPRRLDNWLVVANLWGGVIGRPGILKSPAIQAALGFLHQLEREAKARFGQAQKDFQASQILADARRTIRERELRAAVKDGGGEDLAAAMAADELKGPTRRRYVVNDSTVEKVGEILNENPNGVLVYRDELTGQLRALDKDGQEGARSFYLQAWNGDGSYTYDRIARGTIDIEAAILSVFGSIQPGPLEAYLLAAFKGGQGDDGLLQRFQVLVYPDQSPTWENHDRRPDPAARETAMDVFRWFDELTADGVEAEEETDDAQSIPFLRFTDEAQWTFDSWRERLERHLRSGDEDESFESHLAKYRSLVPSLALIYHLADAGKGPVGVEPLRRAIVTSEYLEGHARRIYAAAISPELSAARALAAKLRAREVKDPFSVRDVYQKGWRGLADKASVERAVGVLCDLDWISLERKEDTGGAPKNQFRINPRIWESPKQATHTTGRRWSDGVVGVVQVPDVGDLDTPPPNGADAEQDEHEPEPDADDQDLSGDRAARGQLFDADESPEDPG